MKNIFLVFLVLSTVSLMATDYARQRAHDQLRTAMTQLENNCRDSYHKIKGTISQANEFKSKIMKLRSKVNDYNGLPSSIKSNLNNAKNRISWFLDASYSYKRSMDYCNSWHPRSMFSMEDMYKDYQHIGNKVQEATNEYQKKSKYYSEAINYYNKALDTIRKQ